MKALIYFILFLFVFKDSIAQSNLIPNSSFEILDSCPNGNIYSNSIAYLYSWRGFGDSPDCYNLCAPFGLSVPSNWTGYQYPYYGDGYVGLGISDTFAWNAREYIQAPLDSPLIAGIPYYYSFRLSRPNNIMYSANIGILFSTDTFTIAHLAPVLPNHSHISTIVPVSDTAGWTEIKGTYTPDSSYRYITFGNFYDYINTNLVLNSPVGQPYAYYYIDNVCLSSDSTVCFSVTGIDEMNNSKSCGLTVFPNPFSDVTTIQCNCKLRNGSISIYNSLGQVCDYLSYSDENKIQLNRNHMVSGIYFISISVNNELIAREKLIVLDK